MERELSQIDTSEEEAMVIGKGIIPMLGVPLNYRNIGKHEVTGSHNQ